MPATKLPGKRKKPARAAAKPTLVPALPQQTKEQSAESSTDPRFQWRQRVTPAILLALITFAIYFQVTQHPFVNYDDGEYVGDNINVQRGVSVSTIRWALTSTEHANWHPVTWLSHALDWQLFGSNPSGHHLTSLLLHVANVVLLFLFLAGITNSTTRSLLVAAIFALHPLCVESTAWIAERKNVLCATFFLLALMAYARYAKRPTIVRYGGVVLLFALALASKPMVVTLPFVLLLLDYWPLQRIQGWGEPSAEFPAPQFPAWKIALEKLPLLAMSAADSWVTIIAQRQVHAIRAGATFPFSLRFENAIVSYASYVWKALWPTRLAVLYPYPYGGLPALSVMVSALLLIGVSVWVWRERSNRYLMVGWLWFLGMMVPVIGLVQVGEQGMADRYAYLPLMGLIILAVWRLFDLAESAPQIKMYAGVAAAAVLIAFAALSVRQIGFWSSNYDLWSHASAVTENNSVAEDVVGSEILVKAMNEGHRSSDEAQVHFQNAVRINPKDSEAIMNIGADLQVHGRLPEAMEKYRLALEYVQEESMRGHILTDMASAYEQSGDFKTARSYYQQALKIGSKVDNAAFMGFARTFTDEKISTLGPALAAHPTAEGYFELGQLQDSGGYTAAAMTSYQQALKLNPKLGQAQAALDHDSATQR